MGPPTRAFDSPAPHRSTRKNQTNDHGPHTTKRPYSRQRVPSASNLPLFISQPNSLLHHNCINDRNNSNWYYHNDTTYNSNYRNDCYNSDDSYYTNNRHNSDYSNNCDYCNDSNNRYNSYDCDNNYHC